MQMKGSESLLRYEKAFPGLEGRNAEKAPTYTYNGPKYSCCRKENGRVLKCFAASQNTNGKSGSNDFSLTVQFSWREKKKKLM